MWKLLIQELVPCHNSETKRRYSVVKIPAAFSVGQGFDYRSEDRLSELHFVVFLNSSKSRMLSSTSSSLLLIILLLEAISK